MNEREKATTIIVPTMAMESVVGPEADTSRYPGDRVDHTIGLYHWREDSSD